MEQFKKHPLYRRHNIDSAMNSLWEFYKKNFLVLFGLSLVMSLIVQFISASMMAELRDFQPVSTDPMLLVEKIKGFAVPLIMVLLINLLFTIYIQHYIIFNPVDEENTVLVSFFRSLKYYIPFLIIFVLLGIFGTFAVALGVLALIIGAFFAGLYVMTLYFFILPVMMIEGINIGNIISRTFRLAHTNFWTNIGWVAVILLILIVVSLILSAVLMIPFAGDFISSLFNSEDISGTDYKSKPLYLILASLVSALTTPVIPIFACILYFNARAGEEEMLIKSVEPADDRVRVEDLYARPYSDDHPDNPQKNI